MGASVPRIDKECAAISTLGKIFEIKRQAINLAKSLVVTAVLAIPFLVLAARGEETYYTSVSLAVLFVAFSDPGGTYRARVRMMAGVALMGAFLTARSDSPSAGELGSSSHSPRSPSP